MSARFNLLTGVVEVPIAAPAGLPEGDLNPFYTDPNNDRWPPSLCRILYHESVHFWQFLSSGFLANVIADTWVHLERFEKTGEVAPSSPLAETYLAQGEYPFSAYHLFECWARFWDVHTRNPARLVDAAPGDEIVPPGDERPAYTGQAFDRYMQTGSDARLYAAPYRYMLERSGGDSHFVACVFPALALAALGGPSPVPFLLSAFERARWVHTHGELIRRTGNINFDWLNNWTSIRGQVIGPTLNELQMPRFTSGFDAIARGPLRSHPVYPAYLEKAGILNGFVRMLAMNIGTAVTQVEPSRMHEMYATVQAAQEDPWILFGLPGHPDYRGLLGRACPPPRVRFLDVARDPRRPPLPWLEPVADRPLTPAIDALERRVTRFLNAQRAVEMGLPATAFES